LTYYVRVYTANRYQTFVVEADRPEEVPAVIFERLGAGRATILSVTPVRAKGRRAAGPRRGRVSLREMELFCRQMHAMLSAGMTVLECLRTLAAQATNRKMREALEAVAANVQAGFSLASSMRGRPGVFSPLMCSTVAAAEESGRLEEALLWLADSFRRDAEFRQKLKQALTYPAVVVAMAIAVTVGLFTFVVPKFTAALVSGGIPVPALTAFMMAVARNFPALAAGAVLAALATVLIFASLRKRERAAVRLELLLLRVPLVGRVVACLNTSRVLWTLAMLTRTGIDLLRALEMAADAAPFFSLRGDLAAARAAVASGGSLTEGLSGSTWLRPAEVRMLAVGEQAGTLDRMAEQAAYLLEKEAEFVLGRLPALAETATTVIVGAGVLLVMLSLFLPIVSMYQTIQ